jgi:hypothetical protein
MEEQHKEQALQMEQRYEDKLSVMEANILHAVMGNGDNSENLPEVRPTKCGNNFCSQIITKRFHSGKAPRRCSQCLKNVRLRRMKAKFAPLLQYKHGHYTSVSG